MADLIPHTNPRGTYVETFDCGSARTVYSCDVPGCGHVDSSETKSQVYRRAKTHREQHRTALRSGGGGEPADHLRRPRRHPSHRPQPHLGAPAMTAQPQPIRSVERIVADLVDVQDQIKALNDRAANLRAQLVEHIPCGDAVDVNGIKVSVREPNRRFNQAKAVKLLAPEVLKLCKSDGYDVTKIKSFLAPVLLEQCMEAGTGAPIVTVR